MERIVRRLVEGSGMVWMEPRVWMSGPLVPEVLPSGLFELEVAISMVTESSETLVPEPLTTSERTEMMNSALVLLLICHSATHTRLPGSSAEMPLISFAGAVVPLLSVRLNGCKL